MGSQAQSSQTPYELGTGYFSDKFITSQRSIDYIIPAALDCIRSYPVKRGAPFNIADYGCADGGTSLPLMYACVEELRKLHGDGLEIHIHYEDTRDNDFKSLFFLLQGLIPGRASSLTDFSNVYVSACGTTFYNQCFPSDSINFGFSCMAVHWLSKKPCILTESLLSQLSKKWEETEAYKEQAELDWERFLLMRAKELSPGGNLALIVLAASNNNERGEDHVYQIYNGLFKVWNNMAKENIITEDEVRDASFVEYFRSREEIEAPFASSDSLVSKAGLSLVSLEMKIFPSAYKKAWEESGDTKIAARAAVEDVRAWSNTWLMAALLDYRSSIEKKEILNEFYRRLEVEFLQSHCDYSNGILLQAFIIIKKKDEV